MKPKSVKWAGLALQDSMVGFIRIIQPLRFAKREGLIGEAKMIPFTGTYETQKWQFNDRVLMQIVKDSDLLLTNIVWKDEDFRRLLNLRKWSGAKLVIDMDDNIYSVSRDNPAQANLSLILPLMERTLQFCDGISVSTPNLREIYKNFNKNIFVQPNGLDFTVPYKSPDPETGKGAGKSWDQLQHKKKHDGIRIGWRGAYGHKDDLLMIESVLAKIKENYPEVEIVIFSQYKPPFKFSYEHHDWVHLQDFPEALAALNLDIGIVPLVDSAYNRCKSNLNWLEMSAIAIPCVISPAQNQLHGPAIRATTNHEWYEGLANLIEDKKNRIKLGQEAHTYVKAHYDMKQLIHPFYDWVSKLEYRTDLEPENFK